MAPGSELKGSDRRDDSPGGRLGEEAQPSTAADESDRRAQAEEVWPARWVASPEHCAVDPTKRHNRATKAVPRGSIITAGGAMHRPLPDHLMRCDAATRSRLAIRGSASPPSPDTKRPERASDRRGPTDEADAGSPARFRPERREQLTDDDRPHERGYAERPAPSGLVSNAADGHVVEREDEAVTETAFSDDRCVARGQRRLHQSEAGSC